MGAILTPRAFKAPNSPSRSPPASLHQLAQEQVLDLDVVVDAVVCALAAEAQRVEKLLLERGAGFHQHDLPRRLAVGNETQGLGDPLEREHLRHPRPKRTVGVPLCQLIVGRGQDVGSMLEREGQAAAEYGTTLYQQAPRAGARNSSAREADHNEAAFEGKAAQRGVKGVAADRIECLSFCECR